MQLGKDFKKVLKQIEEEKGLSEETIVSSLEAAMVSAYKKFKGGNQHIEVHIDIESGRDIALRGLRNSKRGRERGRGDDARRG